jgi:hypothetical protein
LQFVVMTLVMQTRAVGSERDIRAFATPTVMHFCAALLISAVMTAPWHAPASLAGCLVGFSSLGLLYCFRVLWHAHNAAYQPDWEDWMWYTASPLAAYLVLLGAAVLLLANAGWALIAVAVDALVFVLLGVRNAWDTITFIAVRHSERAKQEDSRG